MKKGKSTYKIFKPEINSEKKSCKSKAKKLKKLRKKKNFSKKWRKNG
jgi:hypothetical protein